jgi:hypothetical protein
MAKSFEDLIEELKRLDELTLLELFDLSSEELVELLRDEIEQNQEYYATQVY